MKIAVVENEKFFFSHGDGVEFPALLLQPLCAADLERRDPQETGRKGEKKKDGTKGYMLLWIVGRDSLLFLSPFPPLLFSLFPQRTLIRLDSSRFRSNDCTPRQWAGGLKFRFRPRRRFLFFSPLFSTTMACSTIDREKFSLVKLSHCPGLSLVSRGSATGLAVVIVSNYLKPRHPTGRNIFFPPPRVSPHCPPPPPTCFPLDIATREAFLPPPPRSQFTEELIPDAERRRGSTKGGG